MRANKPTSKKISKTAEKERLEIIEKRVDIQKKRIEARKEKMSIEKMRFEKQKEILDLTEKKISIQGKRLEHKRMEILMKELSIEIDCQLERSLTDKIFTLLVSLTAKTIDDEKTILGSEPVYTPVLSGMNRDIVLNKLMELIEKT